MKLTFWQKLQLKLSGHTFLEYRKRPGWRGHLPFYVFKCEKHGLMIDYPHGFDERLDCIKCFEETRVEKSV